MAERAVSSTIAGTFWEKTHGTVAIAFGAPPSPDLLGGLLAFEQL